MDAESPHIIVSRKQGTLQQPCKKSANQEATKEATKTTTKNMEKTKAHLAIVAHFTRMGFPGGITISQCPARHYGQEATAAMIVCKRLLGD